ncbi:MAG TPA: cupin domain-containing protein, partial [Nannocystis exedens]|nr:cupin domain-containing protein [Nannocystis exedens]
IAKLDLRPNPEGGYYRSRGVVPMPGGGPRPLMTVIDYLLTEASPRARFHRISADTLHFHHCGGTLRLHCVADDGLVRSRDLGPFSRSPRTEPQVALAGGLWKGMELVSGSYALISEAVVPGWCAQDHTSASAADLLRFLSTAKAHRTGENASTIRRFIDDTAKPAKPAKPANDPVDQPIDGPALIRALDLQAHVEGGFFREVWRASGSVITAAGRRPPANTIYYLLTQNAPLGVFHSNVSSITHFLHSGGPIVYSMIDSEGSWHEVVLGRDRAAGQVLSFTCPGGWWKSSGLATGAEHGLISEIVAPGFVDADRILANAEDFRRRYPELEPHWRPRVPSQGEGERGR